MKHLLTALFALLLSSGFAHAEVGVVISLPGVVVYAPVGDAQYRGHRHHRHHRGYEPGMVYGHAVYGGPTISGRPVSSGGYVYGRPVYGGPSVSGTTVYGGPTISGSSMPSGGYVSGTMVYGSGPISGYPVYGH